MKSTLCFTVLLTTAALVWASPPAQEANTKKANASHDTVPVDPGLTLDQMKELANKHGAQEIIILDPSNKQYFEWILFDGVGVGVGSSKGKILTNITDMNFRDGVWFFENGFVITHEDGYTLELKEPTLIVSGSNNISTPIAKQFVGGGGVSCGPGYYACCGKNQHGQWLAKCIPNGSTPSGGADNPVTCINGGEGATGCTYDTAAYLSYEP